GGGGERAACAGGRRGRSDPRRAVMERHRDRERPRLRVLVEPEDVVESVAMCVETDRARLGGRAVPPVDRGVVLPDRIGDGIAKSRNVLIDRVALAAGHGRENEGCPDHPCGLNLVLQPFECGPNHTPSGPTTAHYTACGP